MAEAPSLVSLCIESTAKELLRGDDLLPYVCDLPSDLFDALLPRLPPLALQKLQNGVHEYKSNGGDSGGCDCCTVGRKRRRNEKFNLVWKSLCQSRWADLVSQMQVDDWQEAYWELHLQNCLDEAAEKAVLPSFNGRVSNIIISETILKRIGLEGQAHSYATSCFQLHQHFQQFGYYVRSVRLQSVLCIEETCDLLRNCRLESLNLSWIRSKKQVDALCQLISQHCDTLSSLKFVHCKLSSNFINSICGSLCNKSMRSHGIQSFSICASVFLDNSQTSLPLEFSSFLISGRCLGSLKFCDVRLDRNHGKLLFTSLLDATSGLSVLDLSDNNISGWLSNFNISSLSSGKCFQSLRVLNLRGNNLHKEDIDDLSHAIVYMLTLQKLDIGDNPIGDDGIRSLIPLLMKASEVGSPLVELNLGNCDLSSYGVAKFLNTLIASNIPLKSLCIADNSLGSQIAAALVDFLGTAVEELDFGGVGLGPSGFHELLKITSGKLKIAKIDVSKNRGGIQSARFLSKLIEAAPDLVDVNAAYNLMPPESLAIICSALKDVGGNLKLVNLTGNGWEEMAAYSALLDLQCRESPFIVLDGLSGLDAPYDDDP